MDVETQEIRLARQRASVKWLLSKAFNNRVPDNLKEPFYRDHENQERLKPQIIVELGNATLYCQTLSNIYSDPNYQSLNHWSILQTLSRKGISVAELPDMPLTETVLIQTNPLRISAHMCVIESLMVLYAKEILSSDRVPSAIRRISGSNYKTPPGQNCEQSLLAWISHACAALKRRIAQEIEAGVIDENGVKLHSPDIPPLRDFQDTCDGVCLALLISYYCPKVVPWTSVRINYLPAVEDSIYNVLLVSNFSQKHLPYSVFHMTPEDITYMRGSMKLNLIVLLADLFNLFEVHPAKCVCYPGKDGQDIIAQRNAGSNEYGICHRRGLTTKPVTPIPDLRSESDALSGSPTDRPPFQVTSSSSANALACRSAPSIEYQMAEQKNEISQDREGYVVHKSRGITTLSSMHSQLSHQQEEPLVPARLRLAKEKTNVETKADERGDNVPAGRPSNWEQSRRPSYAGRRSRRNSSSEDSQLTIENFGGSQEQLNAIGRSFDRDRERKLSSTSACAEPAVAVRSSIVDARGTLQLGYDTDSGSEKQDRETEKFFLEQQGSSENISLRDSNVNLNNITSNSSIPTHKQHSSDKDYGDVCEQINQQTNTSFNNSMENSKPSNTDKTDEYAPKRKSSYTGNTQAWQQTIMLNQSEQIDPYEDESRSMLDVSKLSTIRMKLEEKRRRIEEDKRKIEMAISRHQEKVGKPESDPALSKDEIETSSDSMRWERLSNDSKRASDIDPNEIDKYQSIYIMNSNLQDIQQDIQRLATHQSQIQAQQLQAHQLMQAQQISNMLNKHPYGSQQHLAGHFQHRLMQQQQNFGSTPHLPQSYNSSVSAYNSRPPSRDPYTQQIPPQPIQYINEHGQYINQQLQQSPSMITQAHFNVQQQNLFSDNSSQLPYNNLSFGSAGVGVHQYLSDPQSHYQYHPHHPQQYVGHQIEYDEYHPPLHRGRDPNSPKPNPFYLHESSTHQQQPQRRTWLQSTHDQQQFQHLQPTMIDVNAWQSQNNVPTTESLTNWNNQEQHQGSFNQHQSGGVNEYGHDKVFHNLFPVHSSPQHTKHQLPPSRQHSMTNLRDIRSPNVLKSSQVVTAQPPGDDIMAPQSICFIGDEEDVDEIEKNIIESMQSTRLSDYNNHDMTQQKLQHIHHMGPGSSSEDYENDIVANKVNITSGNLTYRIPSPSRPSLNVNSFQDPRKGGSPSKEKGFYISFDDDQPKKPKPPLRAKRSPKKEKEGDNVDTQVTKRESISQLHNKYMENDSIQTTFIGSNNFENNKATYNKYIDPPIQFRQLTETNSHYSMANNSSNTSDRRHLEDVTNQQQTHTPTQQISSTAMGQQYIDQRGKVLVVGSDVTSLNPDSVDEMERRKEKIMLLSLQRRQQQEETKARKEIEANQRREREREKDEERARKKEEQMARRTAILEQHRLKKAIEEAEREGKTLDRSEKALKHQIQSTSAPRLRQQKVVRPRPKTIHVDAGSVEISEASSISSRGKKGSNTNLTESPDEYPSSSSTPIGRRGSYKTTREPTAERGRTFSRISVAKGSTLTFRGRKSNSLMNLCDTDSGLGRSTPPRRAPSPGMSLTGRHMPSPSGPGSLPPGLVSKRRGFEDGSSDISSTPNSIIEYSGPKLYKQPEAKSNRGIILNAVEYCVFPGAVNRDAKQKVLEKIARSEAKHFLILFRDAGCQFRALYSYAPERDHVSKLYGTGPSQVDEVMFDKFFKYNSGGKCFSQVHTKHLTVTIDAFTIHNSLWQGKKVHLPSKKDMALVI